MQTRFLVPTLAALAAIPAAQAFEIDAADWELSIEPRIQSWIEFASVSDAAGEDFDPFEGATPPPAGNEDPTAINFQMRRVRLYFKGSHSDGWKFNITFMADHIGEEEDRDNTGVDVRYAWVGKKISNGDIDHYIQFGVDKAGPIIADPDSSSKQLFPNGRLTAGLNGPRGMDLKYQVTAPVFNLMVDIAEQEDSGFPGSDNGDWWLSARAATGLKEEWQLGKRSESFLGKEGFAHEVGVGVGIRVDGSDDDDAATVFGVDYNVHYNQLSGNFDFAYATRDTGPSTDVTSMIVSAQAGYVVNPGEDLLYEPALRVQMVDADTDDDNEMGVLIGEGGASGIYVDAGLNAYVDGHHNKFQAAVQFYSPEDGDGDGFIFRLANQLDF